MYIGRGGGGTGGGRGTEQKSYENEHKGSHDMTMDNKQ